MRINKWVVPLVVALLLWGGMGISAQVEIMPMPQPQYFGNTGLPLNGGKIYTCNPGTTCGPTTTTELKTTYTDSTGATPNANPVVLNSSGRAASGIWVNGYYKVSLYTSAGVLVWSVDNVSNYLGNTYEIDALSYSPFTFTQAAITAACTAIGSGTKTLLLHPGTWTISSNVDWAAICPNTTFKVPPGAIISHGAFTISMPMPEAGPYQILSGTTGTITYNSTGAKQILPEWYGAVGDASTNNATAINKAFADGVASYTGNFAPTVYFGRSKGFNVASALTAGIGVNIIQDSPIIYTGSSNITVLTVGTTAGLNQQRNLKLDVTRTTVSDWTSTSAISIKLLNIYQSQVLIEQASKSTIGLLVYASTSYNVFYNQFTLNGIANNKYGLKLSGEDASAYVNNNLFVGGRFYVESGVNSTVARYGIQITDDSTAVHNDNTFLKPSFELNAVDASSEAVAILTERASDTAFLQIRLDGNDEPIMRMTNNSTAITIDCSYTDITSIEENGTYAGTQLTWKTNNPRTERTNLLIFDSGYFPHNSLVSYSGATKYAYMSGMFGTDTAGVIAQVLTDGGTATTLADVYDSYITYGNQNALGIVVDTSLAKNFYATTVDAATVYGRFIINCYDSTGTLLTSAGAGHPYVKTNRSGLTVTYTANWGGGYQSSSNFNQISFSVGSAVKSIHILFTGNAGLQLTNFRLYSDYITQVNSGYSPSSTPGIGLAVASPKNGLGAITNAFALNPAVGSPVGWMRVFRLNTTASLGEAASSVNVDVTSSTGALNADLIGVMLNTGAIHWTTIASGQTTTTLVLTDVIPSTVTAGNAVYIIRWKAMANL